VTDRATCWATGKRCFGSRKAAHEAMATAGNRVRVYRCQMCCAHHVTRIVDADEFSEEWQR
jgi:hypothetical protein